MSGALRSGDAEVEASAPGDPSSGARRLSRRRGPRRRRGPEPSGWSGRSAPPERSGRPSGRTVLRVALVWLVAGVAVGLLWRFLTPLVVGRLESYETDLAGDAVLVFLEVVAGVVAAAVGLRRSGAGAAHRFAVAVLGAAAASGTAWVVGSRFGGAHLDMAAVLLLWPLAVAATTVLVTLVATLALRDPYDEAD